MDQHLELLDSIKEDIHNYKVQVREMYENSQETIKRKEQEEQDLLHAIEFSPVTEEEKLELYDRLARTRRERRAAKNTVEILKPLYDLRNDFGNLERKLSNVRKEMKDAHQSLKERKYNMRVCEDLESLCNMVECVGCGRRFDPEEEGIWVGEWYCSEECNSGNKIGLVDSVS